MRIGSGDSASHNLDRLEKSLAKASLFSLVLMQSLDILQFYTIYATNSKKKKIKVVCRYQQYEGANAIVERVRDGLIKKGLIWHFQGSGKSILMLFAAQKLRKQQDLHNPTVMIVVDRVDLDAQITATFNTAEVPNMVTVESIKELHKLLEQDSRKIIITIVHKFKDAYADMNLRQNIIVMVDEAHRRQEGDLGRKMRNALPNAFLFGLTGTPINKADKNTFWAFGAEQDSGGYMTAIHFRKVLETTPRYRYILNHLCPIITLTKKI